MDKPKTDENPKAKRPPLSAELGEDFDDAEERYIHETLAILRQSYEKEAKPYIDRLVAIRSARTPRMLVTVEKAEAMGFKVPNYSLSGRGET